MLNSERKKTLKKLFKDWCGEELEHIFPLPPSASYREYYRLSGNGHRAIGAFNADGKENIAFLAFTHHFLSKGIAVPKVYKEAPDQNMYLLEDLGETTLYDLLHQERKGEEFPLSLVPWYKKSLEGLVKIQVEAGKDLDYSLCYPRASFDRQSMLWDLNYFKYYFLKLAKIPFDEQGLENDFDQFCAQLLEADCEHFLFRDFQARNIMINQDEVYFIDYQGGRKGALQYDLASILFQSKANLSSGLREELLEHYLEHLEQLKPVDRTVFLKHFYYYVLIRLIQVLGAYGFRGFYERKPYFLESIPYALKNLAWLIDHDKLPNDIPELSRLLKEMVASETLQAFGKKPGEQGGLTLRIQSFSYRSGIPEDPSGNGGGYVFDCRSIHNPGRYQPYQRLTGRDKEVIAFLEEDGEILQFLDEVYSLVDKSVEKYLSRNFTHLMVSFGCTGGQHRSVYSADALAKHVKEKYDVNLIVKHIEQERKGWVN